MIKNLNIPDFGSFQNFIWRDSVRDTGRNVGHFKRLNVIYGRNYSGKTTLSRIIRSLEKKELPTNFENAKFEITIEESSITERSVSSSNCDIRVYNRDFVKEHLGFLLDDDGHISPFAIIGGDNKKVEQEIRTRENQLGEPGNEGLRNDLQKAANEYEEASSQLTQKIRDLDDRLRKKATDTKIGIKYNSLYAEPNYNISRIRDDITKVRNENVKPLSRENRTQHENSLRENLLPKISLKINFSSELKSLQAEANSLLQKEIRPTEPIRELLEDSLLQAWAKQGISLHKGKRNSCGFCGNPLSGDLWRKLSAHFDKQSQELSDSILLLIRKIDSYESHLKNFFAITDDMFYASIKDRFASVHSELISEIESHSVGIALLRNAITERLNNIFSSYSRVEVEDNTPSINRILKSIEDLTNENDKKSESLDSDKKRIRQILRLDEISTYIEEIDLSNQEIAVESEKEALEKKKQRMEELYIEVKAIEEELSNLKIQLKDEKAGADRVNYYLRSYFGHNGLQLEAIEKEDGKSFKFQIKRGDYLAFNLSEGECSLVAFCYFIAKLEDTEASGKELILFIDDPISSLDNNHIFFIYSLIHDVIASPVTGENGEKVYRYKQLFISTHNLEFLKYLKRLDHPGEKAGGTEHFFIVSKERISVIELMPKYLRLYVTEFNYLFDQICVCAQPGNYASHYHSFYSFGNNLRKFLEIFLYFKYPFSVDEDRDQNKRIEMFFRGAPGNVALVNRLMNEMSHLAGGLDRGAQPIDREEIAKLAMFVIRRIREKDEEQLHHLLKSVGRDTTFLSDAA